MGHHREHDSSDLDLVPADKMKRRPLLMNFLGAEVLLLVAEALLHLEEQTCPVALHPLGEEEPVVGDRNGLEGV
jgi:hypothetical protein